MLNYFDASGVPIYKLQKKKPKKTHLKIFSTTILPSARHGAHIARILAGARVPAEVCAHVRALARGAPRTHVSRALRERPFGKCHRTRRGCMVRAHAGALPCMPLRGTTCLISGCYSTRRAARSWRAVARVAACLYVPLGTNLVGAIVPAECAPARLAGCFP